MEVIYSIGATFGGEGIGTTSYFGARGFWKGGVLKKVIAQDYRRREIPNTLVTTCKPLKYADLPLGFLRARFFPRLPQYELMDDLYDRWAARQLERCDVFHGWIGHSHRQLVTARRLGAVTSVELASAAPLFQRRLMVEEFRRWRVPLKNLGKTLLQRNVNELKITDYIKTLSSFTVRTLEQHGIPEDRTVRVTPGVDLDEFRAKRTYGDGPFTAIFVGNVNLMKGIPYLLEAWKRLRLPDSRLFIIGAINHDIRSVLKLYRRLPGLKLVGHADPRPYLAQADVLVFPSLTDGFGLVILEAMATGLPVITTENTGGPDVVREGKEGFIIPIRDVTALVRRIRYYADNPQESRRHGKSARRVAERHSWEAHGKELVQAYRRIAETGKRHAGSDA